ncbi:unnamed protein product [Clonostachys rosea f. rosea IK726]|jgi:pyruvate decarboxylase|uniref:Pyruvate decarboxylase n=2 Tax=Bionectria ochroleuca TaxID=29856 RepID=A0A0B7KAB7_BIOOC|nr:unnamed protein product [Clonostachys rosea f. rosea IK726]
MSLTSIPSDAVKCAEYIFSRLYSLGIRSVFGVPGDYNLRLLDIVEPAGLHWVGNCNELNAAYAADGYSRINGISALITTFGVGELSAANGIAGAYAEKAPVVHIVGTPARSLQDRRVFMHHTLVTGDYRRFAAVHQQITAAQVNLVDPQTAPDQIDWVLQEALFHQRPVYIEVPDDMADALVSTDNLKKKPVLPVPYVPEAQYEDSVVERVLGRLNSAKRPAILLDGETRGLQILDLVEDLSNRTMWPTWTTIFGKSLIDESMPNVYGIFQGKYAPESWGKYFQTADLILHFGPHLSDTNSFGFSAVPRENVTIAISQHTVRVDGVLFRDLPPRRFMSKILSNLQPLKLGAQGPSHYPLPTVDLDRSLRLTQKHFYHYINSIFNQGDIILAETGTAAHGCRQFKLPPKSRLFTAVTWLSVGYMVPAALGAALAQRELLGCSDNGRDGAPGKERVVLFVGDGSLQMTVQEISTMIREGLNITIIILNNNGYTIERAIHGRKQRYNDIASWNHAHILPLLEQQSSALESFPRARTWGELEAIIQSGKLNSGMGVVVIEVLFDQEDCEGSLREMLDEQIRKGK